MYFLCSETILVGHCNNDIVNLSEFDFTSFIFFHALHTFAGCFFWRSTLHEYFYLYAYGLFPSAWTVPNRKTIMCAASQLKFADLFIFLHIFWNKKQKEKCWVRKWFIFMTEGFYCMYKWEKPRIDNEKHYSAVTISFWLAWQNFRSSRFTLRIVYQFNLYPGYSTREWRHFQSAQKRERHRTRFRWVTISTCPFLRGHSCVAYMTLTVTYPAVSRKYTTHDCIRLFSLRLHRDCDARLDNI